jgi:hypothetical protein
MKILKKGTPPPPRTFQGTCRDCGCQIEVTLEEVTAEMIGSSNPSQVYYTVKCPTKRCNYLIAVHEVKREQPKLT